MSPSGCCTRPENPLATVESSRCPNLNAATERPAPAAAPPAPAAAAPALPAQASDPQSLATRALDKELGGDREGAIADLRAAVAGEKDPARRRNFQNLLRLLEGPK